MAQLRQDFQKFVDADCVILVVGPENKDDFKAYFVKENLPFIGMADPEHHVLKLYGQQIKIYKYGRMPAQMIIDKKGIVRFVHYGDDMTDIPSDDEVLQVIAGLNAEAAAPPA